MEKDGLRNVSKCVVIGGSAGSLKVLMGILPNLAESLNFPIIIILHRKNDRRSSLETLLNNSCSLLVKEAEDKESLRNGVIYVAPPDYHLLIERDHSLSLDASEKVIWSRPSIDVTFQSASEVYQKHLMGVLLSGANNDGTLGLQKIKESGGKIIIQDPEDADMPVMPQLALDKVKPDYLLKARDIAAVINKFK
jgi:two-component system chemotaxis response regulator CheB